MTIEIINEVTLNRDPEGNLEVTNNVNPTITALLNCRTFKTNVHKLANELHISDTEAKSLLLDECINKRLRGVSKEDLTKGIRHNDPVLLWKITYAKRDIISHHYHELNKQEAVTDSIKSLIDESYSMDTNEDQLDLKSIKDMLPKLFSIAKTRDFIMSVLTVGKKETLEKLDMTSRAFGQKLKGIQHYATDHRLKFNKVVKQQANQEAISEIKLLKTMTNLIESEDFEDEQLTELLAEPEFLAEANELVDCPNIKSQYAVVYQFDLAYQEDKYTFVNNVYSRLSELEKEILNG